MIGCSLLVVVLCVFLHLMNFVVYVFAVFGGCASFSCCLFLDRFALHFRLFESVPCSFLQAGLPPANGNTKKHKIPKRTCVEKSQ